MKNFNYNLTIQNNDNEIEIKTNDVSYAIREYLRADKAGCEVCLCNGFTGEVLCNNGDEPYCTEEMALMILGYLCAEAWGDEDEDEKPIDPAVALISSLFGISTDEAVALHNGKGLLS